MEILSFDFAASLFAIVVIDLVLAGDNAIVIALAARSLPRRLQKRAIVWGTVGAIAVRSTMTLVVVWLLKIPGLLLIGGGLLIWIAYRLLLPENGNGEGDGAPAAVGIWGAIQTIVVADMVMGLDNVLAVAGAAHGSYLLVALGLLISVPIVVWGSTLMLRWVERHPVIIYFGAGVLAWTAAKMITTEPYLKDALDANGAAVVLLYVAAVGGVLWAGFVRNHRRLESRISARLAMLARKLEVKRSHAAITGGDAMLKILVPVDGSNNSRFVVPHVIKEYMRNRALRVHLLNVQSPFPWYVAQFVSKKNRAEFHQDQADKTLRPVIRALDGFGVPYSLHVKIGDKARLIAETARGLGCDHIVMSTARSKSLTRMLQDSTTDKVLEQTSVPVEVIAGEAVSRLERYGLPVGLASALGLFVAAAVD